MEMKWKLAAVSVTGESHTLEGADCEDAFFVDQTKNGFVVGVVSDGAGSARFGGTASRLICRRFELLTEELSQIVIGDRFESQSQLSEQTFLWAEISKLLENALNDARTTLFETAVSHQADPNDFLATVVGVIAHPIIGVTVFHIGDGAATMFDSKGSEIFTSQPENGEYQNLTYFLVEDNWQEHLRGDVIHGTVSEIFLMTDGVTDLGYVRQGRILTPEKKFFGPLSSFLCKRDREVSEAALKRSLDSEGARERVNDDKTLIWIKLLDYATIQ